MAADFHVQVTRAAEELSTAVAEQWRREERLRRVQDPAPIPIRWTAADPLLSDHVENIRRIPTDEVVLEGSLSEAVDAFAAVPSRRLVVLGQPGSGKTLFTIRFTLDLLDRRQKGDPVPVILGLHTWNPVEQSLQEWMARRLASDYPTLGITDKSGWTIASELVRRKLIIPVLDGLDEVAEKQRSRALRALNMSLDRDAQAIVTCREADYRQIVTQSDVLTSAAVIELLPLDLDDLAEYLPRTARKISSQAAPGFVTKWTPILERLRDDPSAPSCRTLLEALGTPLMTSLSRSIYSDTDAEPAELLDGGFASKGELEAHLLNAFVPAAFAAWRWHGASTDDAERHLRFLARHLNRLGTRDLEWWRLEESIPAPVRWLMPGLIAWISIGVIFGTFPGTSWAWLYGAVGAIGLTAGLAVKAVSLGRRLWYVGISAIPAGVIAGLTVNANSYGPSGGLRGEVFFTFFSLLGGFCSGISLGAVGFDLQHAPTVTPLRLRRNFRTFSRRQYYAVRTGLGKGFAICLWVMLALGLAFGITQVLRVQSTPSFPPGGSAVTHLANGDSYVDYPNDLRYIISSAGGKKIVTRNKLPFYAAYSDGVWSEQISITKSDCLVYDFYGKLWGCRAHPAEMFEFMADQYGIVDATVIGASDPSSPYYMDPDINTVLNTETTNWLTEPRISDVTDVTGELVTLAGLFLVPVFLIGGLLLWLAFPSDTTQAISPAPTLRTDRNAAIFRGLAVSLLLVIGFMVFDLATGKVAEIWHVLHYTINEPTSRVVDGHRVVSVTKVHIQIINGRSVSNIALLMTWQILRGMIWGIGLGLITVTLSPWWRFQVARSWLAYRGRLPLRLMTFLEQAHTRGVLRQAGAAYQFRHARLQERLADHHELAAGSVHRHGRR
jgi:GTPase SAR1 family protein